MRTTREEMQRICPNGKVINFIMTRAKGAIWLQRVEGVPYLHIRPTSDGKSSKVEKFCKGFGMLPMCEILKPINAVTFEDICGL